MRQVLLSSLVLILLWPSGLRPDTTPFTQVDTAVDILESMTPEERVGQLFIVTFDGSSDQIDDSILELISQHHISGVLLRRRNDNFEEEPNTLIATRDLIRTLQRAEYDSSLIPFEGEAEGQHPAYVPIFVAIDQEGGVQPPSEILWGLTDLPSQMSIGATWNTELARDVGSVLGSELEALGFNMLIGPSLDVLVELQLVGSGDVGVRTFGGDPYWVGVLGQSLISGVHSGSNERIAVIAKHFPGLGSSDRSIEEEVATVRKSLEQLKQIELAPFLAVTQTSPGTDLQTTDGLLTSHIRYQGFQGNIRATTRPVSLDPQAFSQLMALEPLASWRENGGISVSDSLGSRAIRRFRDPHERTFLAHLVARDAFLAGNDLLLLSDFQATDDPDEMTTILSTLSFFAQKYREDPAFAENVDEAVLRILRLKLRLYGGAFSLGRVSNISNSMESIGESREVTFKAAQEGATLISPSQEEVEERVGGSPKLGERIVFFTDVRRTSQCTDCSPIVSMEMDALENAILRLYGQGAAGEVGAWNLRSFSMADLANFLGEPAPTTPAFPLTPSEEVDEALRIADWLIFSILDSRSDTYGANALKLLLDQRPDLAREKRLVVFGHSVPYALDATDISKIDVYYELYSSAAPFVDTSARLLFGELPVLGAPPVSVPGIGYDLIVATAPDPDQVITLSVSSDSMEIGPEGTPLGFSVGDLIQIETGIITDANGNQVPDGTVVVYTLDHQTEGVPPISSDATIQNGVARISVTLERTGLLSVTARSDPARVSDTLQLNVQLGVPAQATVISPTVEPTQTFEPATTPLSPTTTPDSSADAIQTDPNREGRVGPGDLLLGLLGIVVVAGAGFASSNRFLQEDHFRARCTLLPVLGGLLGYNYLALSMPGSTAFIEALWPIAGLVFSIIGGLLGLAIAQIWCRQAQKD